MSESHMNPARRFKNPYLPYLETALTQLAEELGAADDSGNSDSFVPFGPLQAFLCTDPNGEMTKSVRAAPRSVGILRFGQPHLPGFNDLPRLNPSAVKVGGRPAKSKPITLEISPRRIVVTQTQDGSISTIECDDLQNVRVDNVGRFFFLVAGAAGAPLCVKATPWITTALALMMVAAARRGTLEELGAEIDRQIGTL
jgi:hypothetical protein